MKPPRFLIIVFGWLNVVFALVSLWSEFKVVVIAHNRGIALSEVSAVPANYHGIVFYRYSVDGIFYDGSAQPPVRNDRGDQVHVYYWKWFPSVSTLKPESRFLTQQLLVSIAFMIVGVVFIAKARKMAKTGDPTGGDPKGSGNMSS